MSEFRIWYASRDPYHCAFRMLRILRMAVSSIPLDTLRVLDMLLMFPPVIHRMSLTQEFRKSLNSLDLEKPSQSFVRLPGNAALWQDLQIYQATAINNMAALGLLSRVALNVREADLSVTEVPSKLLHAVDAENERNLLFMKFLVTEIGSLPLDGSEGLLKRAALPSRGVNL